MWPRLPSSTKRPDFSKKILQAALSSTYRAGWPAIKIIGAAIEPNLHWRLSGTREIFLPMADVVPIGRGREVSAAGAASGLSFAIERREDV
ncbi:hypothetical protein MesoLjLb_71560 [Mesorhizobium sp. L-8-3]|nr:hypothetical protein MesoLjLb_71560 [Mesorhizobium sp. L-8-3]